MEKKEERKISAQPRVGGWFYTEDGMERLKDGGLKGHELFEQSLEKQIGQRYRIRTAVTRQAANVIQSVKGIIPRAMFVSNAIMHEIERRAKKGGKCNG